MNFFRIFFLLLLPTTLYASDVSDIKQRWLQVYLSDDPQEELYNNFLTELEPNIISNPNNAEYLILKANILLSKADISIFSALGLVDEARLTLLTALDVNSKALNGKAYMILGVLYHKVPIPPVSFGDMGAAGALFQTAINMNRNDISTNLFYAQWLLDEDRAPEASFHLLKVINQPIPTDRLELTYQNKANNIYVENDDITEYTDNFKRGKFMTLQEQIASDRLTHRKKAKDNPTSAVYAVALTTLYGEISIVGKNAGNRNTTDDEAIKIIQKFIKGLNEIGTHRTLTDNEQIELDMLYTYVPQPLSEEEIKSSVERTLSLMSQPDWTMKDMGRLMSILKGKHPNQIDGRIASKVLRDILS